MLRTPSVRTLSKWSMAGRTMARWGVEREKYSVQSLKTCTCDGARKLEVQGRQVDEKIRGENSREGQPQQVE